MGSQTRRGDTEDREDMRHRGHDTARVLGNIIFPTSVKHPWRSPSLLHWLHFYNWLDPLSQPVSGVPRDAYSTRNDSREILYLAKLKCLRSEWAVLNPSKENSSIRSSIRFLVHFHPTWLPGRQRGKTVALKRYNIRATHVGLQWIEMANTLLQEHQMHFQEFEADRGGQTKPGTVSLLPTCGRRTNN